jgi:hypothetical protein
MAGILSFEIFCINAIRYRHNECTSNRKATADKKEHELLTPELIRPNWMEQSPS